MKMKTVLLGLVVLMLLGGCSSQKVESKPIEPIETLVQVITMSESDYLITIKDRIDYFFDYIKSLQALMKMAGVISIKDGADALYNGLTSLLQSISSMKPPQKYKAEHNGFIQAVQYAYSASDSIRKYSRSPKKEIAQNINDSVAQLKNYMGSVTSLQKDVQDNLR